MTDRRTGCGWRWLWPLAALAACAVLAAAMAFDLPSRAERRISRSLHRRGVTFCADFQDEVPGDAITMTAIACHYAPRVTTPTGHGRRILPGRRESSVAPANVAIAGKRHDATYSFSVAPDSLSRRQDLANAASAVSGLVVYLENGRVVAALHDGTNRVELAAPWPAPPGAFVTVTAVVSHDMASLHLNGREVDAAKLPCPVTLLPRRWFVPGSIRHPFSGVVNDLVTWERALTPRETRLLCGPNRDIPKSYAPMSVRLLAAARTLTMAASSALRVMDRLVPARAGPAVMRGEHPILALHTSKSDDRHFLRAHEKSLYSGYRTKKAASLRQVDLFYNGRAHKAEAGLDDTYGGEFACRRPAFIVRGDIPELFGPSGVARLYPPEAHALVHPDARDILPLNARYVRLYEDRTFKGLYAVEPFDAPGSAWMARGETFRALHFNGRPKPSDTPPMGMSAAEARSAAEATARSDMLFPWSAVEIAIRRRRHAAVRMQASLRDFDNPIAPVEDIIGGNLAPFFITGDLTLAAAGQGIEWDSSSPDTISTSGEVIRPTGHQHRVVTLTATSPETGAVQKYRLRVMAQERTIPTLLVSIGTLPLKEARSDFMATLIPNDGSASTNFCGLVGAGGGLRHRGNTSYINGVKRSMSLKFDVPTDWPDPAHPARHVLLHSGYSDPTRLRNKICFDAFGAAFAGGGFPAPSFSFCELFINGEWMGVWECSRSVRDLIPDNALLYKVRGVNRSLWRTTDTSMLDCVTHPDFLDADPYTPVAGLFDFTANANSDVLRRDFQSHLHLDNLIGYMLVLIFSNNADGVTMNQYLAQLPDDRRFVVIPWDYDKTFLRESRLFKSPLFNKMGEAFPDLQRRLASRWAELRAGPLSNNAIFSRIDADAARLAPYMDEEWRLLKPVGFDGDFGDALSSLKAYVGLQLDFMDKTFK